jgi:NAD(P)-dependent dehydrogenase (short-subunit alcohol dehydrogenase family)
MAEAGGMEIPGTVALVTGGASGIGLGIARRLLGAGARVAIADNNPEWLAEAVAELGPDARGFELDVTDRAGWDRMKTTVESAFGPVDILVNNAGIGPDLNHLDEMPPAHFDRLVAIKLTGTFNGIQTFVPDMRARRRGHVVNTASMAGLVATARLGAYTAAKFGVVGMSETLRLELADVGVGVSVLCPGLVATRLAETTARAGISRVSSVAPSGEAMDPDRVGAMVVEAIATNRPYIITHPDRRELVALRMTAIVGAFDAEGSDR